MHEAEHFMKTNQNRMRRVSVGTVTAAYQPTEGDREFAQRQ